MKKKSKWVVFRLRVEVKTYILKRIPTTFFSHHFTSTQKGSCVCKLVAKTNRKCICMQRKKFIALTMVVWENQKTCFLKTREISKQNPHSLSKQHLKISSVWKIRNLFPLVTEHKYSFQQESQNN